MWPRTSVNKGLLGRRIKARVIFRRVVTPRRHLDKSFGRVLPRIKAVSDARLFPLQDKRFRAGFNARGDVRVRIKGRGADAR